MSHGCHLFPSHLFPFLRGSNPNGQFQLLTNSGRDAAHRLFGSQCRRRDDAVDRVGLSTANTIRLRFPRRFWVNCTSSSTWRGWQITSSASPTLAWRCATLCTKFRGRSRSALQKHGRSVGDRTTGGCIDWARFARTGSSWLVGRTERRACHDVPNFFSAL